MSRPRRGITVPGWLDTGIDTPAQAVVGAGSPANTGKAGAIHRVTCFAGMPID